MERRLHPAGSGGLGEDGAVVVDPVRDHGPPVVPPPASHVDFVPTPGPVLVGPHLSRLGMDGQALGIPVAVAPDLGLVSLASHEGIVIGHGSVLVQPEDRTLVIRRILRALVRQQIRILAPVSDAHEEMAFAVPREPPREVGVPRRPGVGHEELLGVHQLLALQSGSHQGGGGQGRILVRLGVGQIELTVLGEIRMGQDLQETSLALGPDLRGTGDGLGVQHPVPDDP